MTALHLILPLAVALPAAHLAARSYRRLRPDLATGLVTLLTAISALAVLWALMAVAAGSLVSQPGIVALLGRCTGLLGFDHGVPLPVGLAAALILVASVTSALLRTRVWRAAERADHERLRRSREPVAFVVPGRSAQVVVSDGMYAELDEPEIQVLLAHENSHLRHRHHRFVRVADTAAAAVPVLAPLSRQVRFATERWADEDAAAELGDRPLVARTIARAALLSAPVPHSIALTGVAGSGVPERVHALLDPGRGGRGRRAAGLVGGAWAFGVSVAASSIEFHHLMELVVHQCNLA